MPLDPLDPRHLALSPEQRVADKFATLDRRVGAAERSSANVVIRRRQSAEALAEVSTGSTSPVDLGGPSLAVTVPSGAFVAIYIEADIHCTTTGARVWLYEPTDMPAGVVVFFTTSSSYLSFRSAAGNTGNTGLGSRLMVPATAGARVYALRYSAQSGSETAFFRNRRMTAEVI